MVYERTRFGTVNDEGHRPYEKVVQRQGSKEVRNRVYSFPTGTGGHIFRDSLKVKVVNVERMGHKQETTRVAVDVQ